MYRFLVVDDERIERSGIRLLISKMNLPAEISEAGNGEAALEKLRKDDYSILFTDIKMPFMDGLTLAHEARAVRPDIQIIIFSAYADFRKAQKAIEENVFCYLLKPVEIDRFNKTVLACLERLNAVQASRAQVEALENSNRRHKAVESRLLSALQADTLGQARDELLSALEEKNEPVSGKNRAVGLVLEIIRREYGSDLNLEGIAERVNLTPGYLSTLFHKQMGESLIRYINNYRLDRAAEMLACTRKRIAEIAADAGLSNTSYFITIFRQRFSVTPSQYRYRASGNTGV
jgi:two-component system, response regulator YesN